MAVGFWQKNSHGTMLIDSNHPNIALRSKGSRMGTGNIAISGYTYPVFAIRPVGQRAGYTTMVESGGTRTYSFTQVAGGTIHWYHFDLPQVSADTFGMKLFNAAGELTFHSSLKYARVVDVFELNPLADDWPNVIEVRNYTSGRDYAVVITKAGRWDDIEWQNLGTGWQYRKRYGNSVMIQVDDGQITISPRMLGSDGYGAWSPPMPFKEVQQDVYDYPQSEFMILDVTGY